MHSTYHDYRDATGDDLPDTLATGLGWFSLGLGLAEILAPRMITRAVGLEGREILVRGYGVREIAAGAGILATQGSGRAPWMWSRVGGDMLDIVTVAGALNRRGAPKGNIGLATAALAGVTLVDLWCARRLTDRVAR